MSRRDDWDGKTLYAKACYVPKERGTGAIDLVTSKRLSAIDERLDRVIAQAVETLAELRTARTR